MYEGICSLITKFSLQPDNEITDNSGEFKGGQGSPPPLNVAIYIYIYIYINKLLPLEDVSGHRPHITLIRLLDTSSF